MKQYIKKMVHHDQVGFIPGIQGFFNIHESINVIPHINPLKNKNYMILSKMKEKAYGQNPTPIYDKNPSETGHRRNLLQHNKGHI